MENDKFLELWKEIRAVFDQVIQKYDDKWIERERKINTRFLILFIFRLVIPKDDRGYGNTLLEMFNNFINFGIDNMPKTLAASSICEARMKLDPIIFKELNDGIIEVWNRYNTKPRLWHGLRLYGIDGSKLTLPRELMKAGFKLPGDHAHYPQGLLSGVYDLLTGIPYDFDIVNHNNERTCALKHIKHMSDGSVVVYDRGYFSFELLSDQISHQQHAIFRLQSKTRIKVIDDFWEGAETDKLVLMPPPIAIINEVKKGRSNIKLEPIEVRLIKYTIKDIIYVLLTTLTDQEKYPENIFPAVYHSRWGHEEMLKVSKEITGVKDFHSKYELGVKQELFAHFVIITLLKIVESQSHHELGKKIKDKEPPKRRLRPLKDITCKKDDEAKQEKVSQTFSCTSEQIKVNQKSSFLVIGWALEKILYWEPLILVEKGINFMVDSAKELYQKIRSGRNYPRISKTAPSKWCKRRNKAHEISQIA